MGASLPELEILGYPETKQAYYIRCPPCVARFANPKDEDDRHWIEAWNKELDSAKRKWEEGESETEDTKEEEELVEPAAKKIKMQVSKPTPSPKKDLLGKMMKMMGPLKPISGNASPKKTKANVAKIPMPTTIHPYHFETLFGNSRPSYPYAATTSPKNGASKERPMHTLTTFSSNFCQPSPKKAKPSSRPSQYPSFSHPSAGKTSSRNDVGGASENVSPSTIATEAEDVSSDDDAYQVVKELHVGKAREVIVID